MKCPVCNCPMKQSTYDYETAEDPETWYLSYMPCDCVCSYGASKAVWEALGIAVDALEKIKDECYDATDILLCVNTALEQITAEQKDAK